MKNFFSPVTKCIRNPVNLFHFSRWPILCLVLPLAAFFLLTGFAKEPGGDLFKVSDKSFKSVFENITSQVFFVGEHHDNPHHHANQLDQWVAGNLSLEEFVKTYYENWDQAWV